MTKIERLVELIYRSSDRLTRTMRLYERDPADPNWWWAMQREAWLHLKRTIALNWLIWRKKVK